MFQLTNPLVARLRLVAAGAVVSGIVVVPEFAKPMAAFAIAHNAFHFPFYPSMNMPFCSMLL